MEETEGEEETGGDTETEGEEDPLDQALRVCGATPQVIRLLKSAGLDSPNKFASLSKDILTDMDDQHHQQD